MVESRVVPGSAFASRLARGYAWDENASPVEKAVSGHVPCLAQTRLTDAAGTLLFRGLHRGFLNIPELHAEALMALSDGDLTTLVGEVILGGRGDEAPDNFLRRVEDRCWAIRSHWVYAVGAAMNIQHQVGKRMAMESAAAALCCEPDKLERAIRGDRVEIVLFDIALLTLNELGPWANQFIQIRRWQSSELLRLTLRGPDNELHRVWADTSVRQFALSVQDQALDFSSYQQLKPCVVKLLGEPRSRTLGGDVRAQIRHLRSRAWQLGRELAASGYERVRTLPPGALAHPAGLQARRTVAGLQAELARLEKQARALEQAGQQLKDMWIALDGWPTGADAYRAASRLALVAYLMGETPVLNGPTDRDYTRRLDAEVKVLATLADCHGGHLPPDDLDSEIWESARAALREP